MTQQEQHICCEQMASKIKDLPSFVGMGLLYPPMMRSEAQVEYSSVDDMWNVNGCCGGGCYVMENIKHCPYCGEKLPFPPTMEK